jgi:hypothetical protein
MTMYKSTWRKILPSLLVFFLFIGFSHNAYALSIAGCDVASNSGAPSPDQILCPVVRIFNILLLISGVALATFIGYGAIKLSASLGDPKAYEGAVRTFQFAIIGFFIVVGSFAILFILDKTIFGEAMGFSSPQDIFNAIGQNINQLLCEKFWILQGNNCQFGVTN